MCSSPRPQVDLTCGIARDGGTAILSRHVEWPWSLPRGYRRAGTGGPLTILPQCAGAALLPGDHWCHRVEVQAGGQVDLISAGAMLVHADREAPRLARSDWSFRLGSGSLLRHVPDPNVLMPGAWMSQEIDISIAADARLVLFDGFCRQRPEAPASGGGWRSALRITDPSGRVVLWDRQEVSEGELVSLAALPGKAAAFGSVTAIGIGEDLPVGPIDFGGVYAAVGRIRGGRGIQIRLAACSGGALDRAFRQLRDRLR